MDDITSILFQDNKKKLEFCTICRSVYDVQIKLLIKRLEKYIRKCDPSFCGSINIKFDGELFNSGIFYEAISINIDYDKLIEKKEVVR